METERESKTKNLGFLGSRNNSKYMNKRAPNPLMRNVAIGFVVATIGFWIHFVIGTVVLFTVLIAITSHVDENFEKLQKQIDQLKSKHED